MEKNFSKPKIIFLLPIFIVGIFCGQLGFFYHENSSVNASYSYADSSAIISSFIANLTNPSFSIVERYNLADKYPILSEDQQNSDFCWIYSSLKAIESSFMKQKNEYYNFSEIATALFAYKIRSYSNEFKNMSGNFEYFINAVNEYGLVQENDFSSDNIDTITHSNYEDYMYIANYADKALMNSLKTYKISANSSFNSLTKQEKAKVLKQYIYNYGGLYVSVDNGYFYYNYGSYFTKDPYEAQSYSENYHIGGHALCLIGWDADGLLALNSWGYEQNSRYPIVHIKETEDCIYNYVYGFECGSGEVNTENSSASKFKDKLNDATTNLNNFFCYDEQLSLMYSLSKTKYNNFYVKIFRGEENVTDKFSILKSDNGTKKQVAVSAQSVDGGYHVIKFYDQQNKLIESKSFYVYSGTEFAYFKFANKTSKSQNPPVYDSYVFANSNLSSDRAVTIVTDTLKECEFQFKMNPFCTNSVVNPLNFDINQIYVSVVSNGEQSWMPASNLSVSKISDNTNNNYIIKLNNLTTSNGQYVGEHLYFKIRINSTEYDGVYNEYYFNLIYSPYTSYSSGNLFNIIYHTDGQKNNPTNLEKYTSDFATVEPIGELQMKSGGAKFIAWFEDDDFLTQTSTIGGTLQKNLQLFAFFEDESSLQYLDCELSLDSIYDENNIELFDGKLIYGYKQKFAFMFDVTQRLLDVTTNYLATYDLYVVHNGVRTKYNIIDFTALTEPQTVYFDIQNLDAGFNYVEVVVKVQVSSYMTITKSYSFNLNIEKRKIEVITQNSEIFYDKNIHTLNIGTSAKFVIDTNSILPADRLGFAATITDESGNITARDAGQYIYKIRSVNNSNYTFDTSESATLTIKKLPLTVVWGELVANYDGEEHAPQFTLYEGDNESEVTATTNYTSYIQAKTYNVKINEYTLSNSNYYVAENVYVEYKILPAKIVVQVSNETDRVQTVYWNRKSVSWQITNEVFDSIDDLQLSVVSEALSTDKYGVYPIYLTTNNTNYEVEQNDAYYTLTGHYKITYILPNGDIYEESIEEGEFAKGVTRDIYNIGFFEGFSYSTDINNISDDSTVRVSVKDYKIYAVGGVIFVIFLIIYFVLAKSGKKKRYA